MGMRLDGVRSWARNRSVFGRSRSGFTLVEAVLVAAIVGTLVTMAIPAFTGLREQADVNQAIADLRRIDSEILTFLAANRALPPDLASLGLAGLRDPWGRAYVYVPFFHTAADILDKPIESQVPPGARQDRFLKPLNQDFDLFSSGRDGAWRESTTQNESQDDVLRAYNGGFFGRASEL